MGQVLRFPVARRRADIERAARVFEALRDQERAIRAARRLTAQAVSVSTLLLGALHVLSLTA
jgi:hypothetical protein